MIRRFCRTLLMMTLFVSMGVPSQALSEKGKNLLEELKSKLSTKQQGSPDSSSSPSPTNPGPADEASSINLAPPPTVVPSPSASDKMNTQNPSPEPAVESSDKAPKNDSPAENDTEKIQKKGKKRKAKDSKESTEPASTQTSETSALIQSIRGKMEKSKSEKDPVPQVQTEGTVKGGKESPAMVEPQSSANPLPAASEESKEKVLLIQPGSNAGDGRSFGELSDEELIKYAQEHVWASEKSRKHSPPWTPPSKPRKKSKAADPAAPKKDEVQKSSTKETSAAKSKKTVAAKTKTKK